MSETRTARRGALATAACVLAACIWAAALPAEAQRGGGKQGGGGGGGGGGRAQFGQSLPAPGLSVTFAEGAACAPIASPYGASTRYDGSTRMSGGAEGLHGGIDLTLKEGTPLLAIAPGIVHATGEGGQLEGIFLWIAHLPEQTGMPFGFLAKYQHLSAPSELAPGTRVARGQVVARSGKTGTVGGHYGSAGYPHLHLTVRAIAADKLPLAASGELRILRDTTLIDPLTVYVTGLQAPEEAANLDPDRKRLTVGFVDATGAIRPAAATVTWPVACP